MDRECNCSLPSKVNGKCVYEGKCRSRCIIYEVKCCMCDTIYIGNTQQTFKKRMDVHYARRCSLVSVWCSTCSTYSGYYEQLSGVEALLKYQHCVIRWLLGIYLSSSVPENTKLSWDVIFAFIFVSILFSYILPQDIQEVAGETILLDFSIHSLAADKSMPLSAFVIRVTNWIHMYIIPAIAGVTGSSIIFQVICPPMVSCSIY